MSSRIALEVAGGVAHVQLNRPQKLNALDGEMFGELVDMAADLGQRPGVRAVVLSGRGPAFCAGLDAAHFDLILRGEGLGRDGPTGDRPLRIRTHGIANRAQRAVTVWAELPVPVIAAVHGCCFGGGLQLALGADLRYVSSAARLSIMEIRWGLVPDMAGFMHARKLLAADTLAELVYSGRQVSGEEAARLGLATRVCEKPIDEALAFAGQIAAKSPDAIRAAKRLLLHSHASDDATLLLQESIEQEKLIGSPNQIEAILANNQKRPPRFSDGTS